MNLRVADPLTKFPILVRGGVLPTKYSKITFGDWGGPTKIGEGNLKESHSIEKECWAIFCGTDFFVFFVSSGFSGVQGLKDDFVKICGVRQDWRCKRVNLTVFFQLP